MELKDNPTPNPTPSIPQWKEVAHSTDGFTINYDLKENTKYRIYYNCSKIPVTILESGVYKVIELFNIKKIDRNQASMKDIIIEAIISLGMIKSITLRYYWGISSSVSMLKISDNLSSSTIRPEFGTLWKLEELQK